MSDSESEPNIDEIEDIEKALTNPVEQHYPEEQKAKHKADFEKWLDENYNNKKTTTYIMRKVEYDKIRDVLKGVATLSNANERFKFKKKQYSLMDDRIHQRVEKTTDKKNKIKIFETKKLVYYEEFFDILYDAHCIKRMHQGVTKTFEYIQEQYFGIPKKIVRGFRKFCYVCDLNKIQRGQDRLNPIKSSAIFERVQIDLIDMRNMPDRQPIGKNTNGEIVNGNFCWIGHMEDHNGEMHVLFALQNKEG